jgi:head-tail adaptor
VKLPSAGELDRAVRIERKAVAGDAEYVAPDSKFGTETVVWVPLVLLPGSPSAPATLWAQIQDALPSRAESVLQGLAVARDQSRVRMRWIEGVDSTMRIVELDGRQRTLQIIGGPAELGRREFMELMCEQYSSHG